MKWKNLDGGAGHYFMTGTFIEWLPLMDIEAARSILCGCIVESLADCDAILHAFVLMPDHLHLIVYLPQAGLLHKFCKLWRGRSGRRIAKVLHKHCSAEALQVLAGHANGGCRYAVWKEQARALMLYEEHKHQVMVDYIHANPVRKGLVDHPAEWPWSSYRFYEFGEEAMLPVIHLGR